MGTLTRLLSGSLSSTVYRLVKGGEIMPKAWVSINPSNEDAPITLSTSAGSEQFTADEASRLRDLLDEAVNYQPQEEIPIGDV